MYTEHRSIKEETSLGIEAPAPAVTALKNRRVPRRFKSVLLGNSNLTILPDVWLPSVCGCILK
jgi:hypothetical protein